MNSPSDKQRIKITILGDAECGKTSFAETYRSARFRPEYGVVHDNLAFLDFLLKINDEPVTLSLWEIGDLWGSSYRLRPLMYATTDVFLVFFSIAQPQGFMSVDNKWYPEAHHHNPQAPIILVGTKSDTRNDPKVQSNLKEKNLSFISKKEAEQKARAMKAFAYIECSSLEPETLTQVIDLAIQAWMSKGTNPFKPKKKGLFDYLSALSFRSQKKPIVTPSQPLKIVHVAFEALLNAQKVLILLLCGHALSKESIFYKDRFPSDLFKLIVSFTGLSLEKKNKTK